MVAKERWFGGHGAYSLSKTNLTKPEAKALSNGIKSKHPDYSTRTVKERNGKYSVYFREWKQTTRKQQREAYRTNRESVERSNREFRKDLPGWAD